MHILKFEGVENITDSYPGILPYLVGTVRGVEDY